MHFDPANDAGPIRLVACVDLREVAERLKADEVTVRNIYLGHADEVSEAALAAVVDVFEDLLGILELQRTGGSGSDTCE